jgi:hypothetical protein
MQRAAGKASGFERFAQRFGRSLERPLKASGSPQERRTAGATGDRPTGEVKRKAGRWHGRGSGRVKKLHGSVTLSVRLSHEEYAALIAIAERIGNGATATGVLRQAVKDRIRAEAVYHY